MTHLDMHSKTMKSKSYGSLKSIHARRKGPGKDAEGSCALPVPHFLVCHTPISPTVPCRGDVTLGRRPRGTSGNPEPPSRPSSPNLQVQQAETCRSSTLSLQVHHLWHPAGQVDRPYRS